MKRILLLLLMLGSTIAQAAPVDEAIERGKAYLYGAMNAAGNWEAVEHIDPALAHDPQSIRGPQWSGRTALVVYALLRAGEKPVEPRLQRAIEFLKQSDPPIGTYALSFRCLVWASLPPTEEIQRMARRDAERLAAGVNQQGLSGYFAGIDAPPDMSNSQIALLGLFAARQRGVEIPVRYWRAADRSWRARQLKEGAWTYGPDYRDSPLYYAPHPGMTAAGVATLLLIRDATTTAAAPRDNESDPALDTALDWLGQNFETIFTFDFAGNRALYGLYMIERVGVAGGIKRFGDHVWYDRGIAYVLPRQTPEGAWLGGVEGGGEAIVDTAFALMFLSHARAPVAIGKLRYELAAPGTREPGRWNQRSRDVARAVEWISEITEVKQRWQIVSLDREEDLYDAPLLFVSGDQAIAFDDEQLDRLRRYTQAGGLIVFSADGRNRRFVDAVTSLGGKLLPGGEWRRLDNSHPLLRWQQFNAAGWRRPVTVMAIGDGTREFALLLPDADISRTWQTGSGAANVEHFELATNIVQYAGGPGSIAEPRAVIPNDLPRHRLRFVSTNPNQPVDPHQFVAAGQWMARTRGIALDAAQLDPAADDLDPAVTALVVVKPGAVRCPEETLEWLRAHVGRGGRVLIEASPTDEQSLANAEGILRAIAPSARDVPLPESLAKAIQLRDFVRTSERVIAAPIRLYRVGEARVIIANVNISAGLAGLRHNAIIGLTAQSARDVLHWLLTPER